MKVTRTWRVLAVALLLAMLAAACGDSGTADDDAAASDDDPPVNAAAGEDAPADDTAADDATDDVATDDEAPDDEATDDGGDEAASGENVENPDEGVFVDSLDYGFIYDQTGPTASTQTVFYEGFATHIAAVNEAGGVQGRTINVVQEDERYDVPTGVAAYNRLVDQTPVVGMTALNNSSFQGAVIEEIDGNGVPIIGAESTTEIAVNPYREMFFGMECTYADQADVAVAYAAQQNGGEVPSSLTIYGNVASGEEYAGLIQERVEAGEGEYLGSLSVEYGATEADAQAQEIAALAPDFIFMHGGVSIGIPVLSSLAKFGVVDVPVNGIFAQQAADIPNSAPEIPYSVVNCYANAYEGIDGADELIAEAEAAGVAAETYERTEYVNGWVVARVLVAALEEAGNELTRESLAAAVEAIEPVESGALAPMVEFGPDDRIGVESVKPFEYDAETSQFTGVGEFPEWADCLSLEYLEGSLGDYDPTTCFSG